MLDRSQILPNANPIHKQRLRIDSRVGSQLGVARSTSDCKIDQKEKWLMKRLDAVTR